MITFICIAFQVFIYTIKCYSKTHFLEGKRSHNPHKYSQSLVKLPLHTQIPPTPVQASASVAFNNK